MAKIIAAKDIKVGDKCAISGYTVSQKCVVDGQIFIVWLLCGRTIETYHPLDDKIDIE